jgi:murein DD-endopeptidase MepM/ murein hydrolase activator NlpD
MAECREDMICIDATRDGSIVTLEARNLSNVPLTYTVRARARDMVVDGPRTVTRTLPPMGSDTAISLRDSNSRQQGNVRYSFDWAVGDKEARHDDSYLYALPFAEGSDVRVLQGYNSRLSHTGLEEFAVDFDLPEGSTVRAAREGVVAAIEESNHIGCFQNGCGKYANYIVVLHNDGTTGEYLHLQQNGALVEVGDMVERGQKIGLSGNTGHSTMPHLHFAVYRPVAWGSTQSIPVRFQGADGIIERPRRGTRYTAN